MKNNLEVYLAQRDVFEDEKERQLKKGFHWCSKCKQFKSLEKFNKSKRAKFGYFHWCKSCHSKGRKGNNRYKKKARQHNRKLKSYYKDLLGRKCAKCGYNKTQAALEFHHINSNEKDYMVTKLISTNKHNDIMSEIDKCILLCRNCHMELESYCWSAEFVKDDRLGYRIKPGSVIENEKEFWTDPSDKILYSQTNLLNILAEG